MGNREKNRDIRAITIFWYKYVYMYISEYIHYGLLIISSFYSNLVANRPNLCLVWQIIDYIVSKINNK